jgi:hypothetical protein
MHYADHTTARTRWKQQATHHMTAGRTCSTADRYTENKVASKSYHAYCTNDINCTTLHVQLMYSTHIQAVCHVPCLAEPPNSCPNVSRLKFPACMRYNCQHVHSMFMPPINQSTIFCKTHSVLPEAALGTLTAGRPLLKHACVASCTPIVSRKAVALAPTSRLHPTLDKDCSTVNCHNAGKTGSEFIIVEHVA